LRNNRQSQFELYNYCFDAMMGICMRYENDRDTAMETVNITFVKVLKNLKDYDPRHELLPWVKRITLNTAIDNYRKKVRRREHINGNVIELEKHAGSEGGHSDNWEEREYLEHLLNTLKDTEKTVFNLFAIDGFSHREIAEELGISERTSIRHLTSARKKLQEQLKVEEQGSEKA